MQQVQAEALQQPSRQREAVLADHDLCACQLEGAAEAVANTAAEASVALKPAPQLNWRAARSSFQPRVIRHMPSPSSFKMAPKNDSYSFDQPHVDVAGTIKQRAAFTAHAQQPTGCAHADALPCVVWSRKVVVPVN
jgi:hypothetical protein